LQNESKFEKVTDTSRLIQNDLNDTAENATKHESKVRMYRIDMT